MIFTAVGLAPCAHLCITIPIQLIILDGAFAIARASALSGLGTMAFVGVVVEVITPQLLSFPFGIGIIRWGTGLKGQRHWQNQHCHCQK
jgi:hypothetical protein